MKQTLKVTTLMTDCGDGGWNCEVYNNDREMLDAHPLIVEAREDGKSAEEIEELERLILTEDDAYTNGYVGHDKIVLNVPDGAVVSLAEPLFFHFGQ